MRVVDPPIKVKKDLSPKTLIKRGLDYLFSKVCVTQNWTPHPSRIMPTYGQTPLFLNKDLHSLGWLRQPRSLRIKKDCLKYSFGMANYQIIKKVIAIYVHICILFAKKRKSPKLNRTENNLLGLILFQINLFFLK